jgi:integrase
MPLWHKKMRPPRRSNRSRSSRKSRQARERPLDHRPQLRLSNADPFVFPIFAALLEERAMISQRTKATLARTKARIAEQGHYVTRAGRTFITAAARKCSQAGGSLRDVQQLAGHSSLATTQRYIEGDSDAKRKLVSLL